MVAVYPRAELRPATETLDYVAVASSFCRLPTTIFAAAFRRAAAHLDMQQRMELSWLVI